MSCLSGMVIGQKYLMKSLKHDKVSWIDPLICRPPHRLTHPEKYQELVGQFREAGWAEQHPALIGYKFETYIQLVSGTHRWFAAIEVDMFIPVVLYTYQEIEEMWGTDKWVHLLANPPLVNRGHDGGVMASRVGFDSHAPTGI